MNAIASFYGERNIFVACVVSFLDSFTGDWPSCSCGPTIHLVVHLRENWRLLAFFASLRERAVEERMAALLYLDHIRG